MGFAASFYTATEIASEDAPSTEIGVVRFRLTQPMSRLPIFQSLRVFRKFVKFLQPLIVRDDDDRIALLHLQIVSRIVLKPTLQASYRNRGQARPILNLCVTKR